MRNRARRYAGAAASVVLLSMSLPALAHEPVPGHGPQYFQVDTHHVFPADAEAYEAICREWVTSFREAGLGDRIAWYAASAADFTYTWVTPLQSFAELDRRGELNAAIVEAVGQEKLGELMKYRRYVREEVREILKARGDLSYHPKAHPEAPATFMQVLVIHVKPAEQEAFEGLLKDAAAAFAKGEGPLGFDVYQVLFGQGSYVMVVEAADAVALFGAPDAGDILVKALGPEKALALRDKWRHSLIAIAPSYHQIRSDLSFLPDGDGDGGDGEYGEGGAGEGDG